MISFIIPAHNEELLIGRTIGRLRASADLDLKEPYEIIVVDDSSTDRTAMIAEASGARVFSVQFQQIAAARNAGASLAQGDVLVFVDADTSVPRTVVVAAVQAMRSGAVGGGARAEFEGSIPIYGRVLAWLWRWVIQRFGHFASGCFLFCTRQAFEAAGRFDESLYAAEDVALSRHLRPLGRFVILRESVITSGRNMRSHSASEILRLVAGFVLHGPAFFKTRRGPWYGRRPDDQSR